MTRDFDLLSRALDWPAMNAPEPWDWGDAACLRWLCDRVSLEVAALRCAASELSREASHERALRRYAEALRREADLLSQLDLEDDAPCGRRWAEVGQADFLRQLAFLEAFSALARALARLGLSDPSGKDGRSAFEQLANLERSSPWDAEAMWKVEPRIPWAKLELVGLHRYVASALRRESRSLERQFGTASSLGARDCDRLEADWRAAERLEAPGDALGAYASR